MNKSLIIKDTIYTSVLNIIGKTAGYLIPFFIAYWFGISKEMDLFFYVYGIVFFISMVFANSLENILVPFVAEHQSINRTKEVSSLLNQVFFLLFVILTISLILVFIFTKSLLASITGFDAMQISLIHSFILKFMPFIYMFCFTSLLIGVMNAQKLFWYPSISPGIRSILCVLAIFLFKDRLGINAIVLGYTIGEFARFLGCLILLKHRQVYCFRFEGKISKTAKEVFRKAVFLVMGTFIVGMNPLVDNTVAAWLKGGSISLLEYSNKLSSIPFNLVTYGFLVVFLSHLSESRFSGQGRNNFKNTINRYLIPLTFVCLAISVLAIVLSATITNVSYGASQISKADLVTINKFFIIAMIGFTPYMITQVYVRGFLVLKATKFLLYLAFWKFVLNLIMDVIFSRLWGIDGIVIASAVLNYIALIPALFYFKKALNNSGLSFAPGIAK